MNESLLPSLRPADPSPHPGVYADLAELVRLKFRIGGFSLLPRQPVHSILAGRHASRLRGRGMNFEEIRRYLPGDDICNMDWHVAARTCKPHVRVYTEERDRPVLLVVDQRQSMFFGSCRAMKSVVAAEATALAAWRVLQAGDRVGACVFDDQDVVEIPPQRSEQQVLHILATVLEKNHALRVDPECQANPAIFNRVLARTTRMALYDHLVCLISDESVEHRLSMPALYAEARMPPGAEHLPSLIAPVRSTYSRPGNHSPGRLASAMGSPAR